MMRDLISEKEYELMDCFRNCYIDSSSETPIPMKDILWVWEQQKQTLFKLLGNQLTLKKDFKYRDTSFIEQSLCTMNRNSPFYNTYYHTVSKEYGSNVDVFNCLMELVYPSTLLSNKLEITRYILGVDRHSIEVPLPNNTIYKLQDGCKPMRALAKIAEALNIEGFEEYRLTHSQILNTAEIHGKLCLSIHPFDYMFMSHKSNGWSSCMSWIDGCHRQGSIEMMNSENVVVAYLEGAETVTPCGSAYPIPQHKWRELFIVTPKILTEIKSYPYRNEEITKAALDWLKELAEANLSYDYNPNVEHYRDMDFGSSGISDEIYIECELMYNDFATVSSGHLCYVNDCLYGCDNFNSITVQYSGPCQCMVCGNGLFHDGQRHYDIEYDWYEGTLMCYSCANARVCDRCGEIFDGGGGYIDNGDYVCEGCWETEVIYDSIEERTDYYENFDRLYIYPDDEKIPATAPNNEIVCYPYINTYCLDNLVSGGYIEKFNRIKATFAYSSNGFYEIRYAINYSDFTEKFKERYEDYDYRYTTLEQEWQFAKEHSYYAGRSLNTLY